MSYFGHYVHSGYVTNPFLADDSRKCFFSFDYKNYNKQFIYYDKIMSSYIWTLNYPIWYAEDSKWGYDWQLTSFAIGGRAVLRYSSKYIYYDVKSSKLIIYSDLGYPCSEKAKLEYNYDTNRVETKYVWEDCFISNGAIVVIKLIRAFYTVRKNRLIFYIPALRIIDDLAIA